MVLVLLITSMVMPPQDTIRNSPIFEEIMPDYQDDVINVYNRGGAVVNVQNVRVLSTNNETNQKLILVQITKDEV